MLHLIIDELTHILLSCSIITIKDNVIKCVVIEACYDGSYNWSMFMLTHIMSGNSFRKMSVDQFKYYQRNMCFIGIGNPRYEIINPSN